MEDSLPEIGLISYLFDKCSYDPEKPILVDAIDTSRSLSWNQIRKLIKQISAGLLQKGVKPGDCVCLHGRNDIYNFALVYGVIAMGGIYCSTSYFLKPIELAAAFKSCEATFIFVDPEFAGQVVEATLTCGIPRERILLTDRAPTSHESHGIPSWRTLLDHGEVEWPRITDVEVLKDRIAMRWFTSGTTGAPKVAEVTQYNLVSVLPIVRSFFVKPYQNIFLYQTPMFHVTSSTSINGAFEHGLQCYLANYAGPDAMADLVEKHKITDVFMNPGTILGLVNTPSVTPEKLRSLRNPRCGGASLPQGLAERFQKMLPPETILNQAYGMTECIASFASVGYGHKTENGAVGYVLPHCKVKILALDGTEAKAPNTIGEILASTPSAFKRYLNNSAATAAAFHDGWLRTGDTGYLREDGMLFLTGRLKESFKIFSEHVAPVEVENMLMRWEGVADAAVYPALDEHGMPVGVRAKVVLGGGAGGLDVEGLRAFVRGELADYKVPGEVLIVTEIPRSAIGKIDRIAITKDS